ncbi:CAP domain-containing protein [Amphibacillus sp. Q70]|uniref:CAP domain-containing protein n=1 Tax=Amphibacillus sp. Q70 TaxID=3453416 RepID=UPI003F842143
MFKKIAVTVVVSTTLLLGLATPQVEAAQVRKAGHHFSTRAFNIDLNQLDGNWQEWIENYMSRFMSEYKKKNPCQPVEESQENEDPAEKTDQPEENEAPVEEAEQPEAPEQEDSEQPTEEPEESVETPETEAPVEPTPTEPEQGNNESTEATNSSLHAFERQVVELTNQERAAHGLQPLSIDESLSSVAREKSNDMASNGYFSHNSPTYGSPFDMMQQFGVNYRTAGENIAKGQRSPEEVVNGWMNSEGHRANILNPDYTHIGVGYIENGNHWTQMFIGN